MSYELWKDIEGYEGLYQVSDKGRVKSLMYNKEIILTPCFNTRKYLYVTLYKDGKKKNYVIHRLVCTAFVKKVKNKPMVNHKDGIKVHNYSSNLEWCNAKENVHHAQNNGLVPPPFLGKFGKDHNTSKPIEQYTLDGELVSTYYGQREAERMTGINHDYIGQVARNVRKEAGGFIWRFKRRRKVLIK